MVSSKSSTKAISSMEVCEECSLSVNSGSHVPSECPNPVSLTVCANPEWNSTGEFHLCVDVTVGWDKYVAEEIKENAKCKCYKFLKQENNGEESYRRVNPCTKLWADLGLDVTVIRDRKRVLHKLMASSVTSDLKIREEFIRYVDRQSGVQNDMIILKTFCSWKIRTTCNPPEEKVIQSLFFDSDGKWRTRLQVQIGEGFGASKMSFEVAAAQKTVEMSRARV
ncbi:hypothetical protein ASZ78_009266 [Callipepla squamata]|uniref:Uncharacterized protein n=1 Tax=Callipepla squamata TaxID=9009 RepID=A0A226MRG7_CALSU|nr:hypothetical protein ASZ78_009266 [Callipepla squamata]